MKRRLLLSMLLSLVLVGAAACTGTPSTTQQLVKVSKGDLTVTVSGSGKLEVATEAKVYFAIGGRIAKLYVKEGDRIARGTVIAQLDDSQLQLALVQARYGLAQAKLSVRTAELDLSKTTDTYKWPDIQVAQSNVDEAKNLLQYATLNLQNASSTTQLQQWAAAVISAQISLVNAEAKLKAQTIGYDTEQVEIKRAALALAYQSVDLAQQTLIQAQKQLDDATLTTPIDGVALKVGPRQGDTVSTQTMIVHLIDLKSLELKVSVDEIDIPAVKAGQTANITLDALPETNLQGKVTTIAHTSTIQSGVVSYEVTISFTNPSESLLRVGMSATVDIVVNERKGVLLIPNRAIQQSNQGKPSVKAQAGTLIEDKEITTGVSDGLHTEVTGGLQEGDTVVITTKASPSSSGGLFGG